jgi:hypothetical protein
VSRKTQSCAPRDQIGGTHEARSLVEAGLIDEHRHVIQPVVQGADLRLLTGPLSIERSAPPHSAEEPSPKPLRRIPDRTPTIRTKRRQVRTVERALGLQWHRGAWGCWRCRPRRSSWVRSDVITFTRRLCVHNRVRAWTSLAHPAQPPAVADSLYSGPGSEGGVPR